jgi:hypothetical protein
MEQMGQQIREMLGVRLAVINRGDLEDADAQNAKMEPLWTCLWAEMEADIKARQDKLDANWANINASLEKRKANMKAMNEMMERREAEKKPMTRR